MTRGYLLFGTMALAANSPAMPTMSGLYERLAIAAPSTPPPVRTSAFPAAQVLSAGKDDDGLFRLTGRVDRQRVRFVVDTGATTTVLSGADANRLGVAEARGIGGLLRTADGTAAMTWRRLRRLDIADRHLTDLDVVVLRHGPTHSLLGQDVLARLGRITIDGDRLEVRPRRS